jgi:hypothetical protein
MGDNVTCVQEDVSKLFDLDRLCETVNAERRRMPSLGLNLSALLAMPRSGRCFRALQSVSLGERSGHQDSQKCPYRPLFGRSFCLPAPTTTGATMQIHLILGWSMRMVPAMMFLFGLLSIT